MSDRPQRILVVDDNDLLRALLGAALEAVGFEVISAESAEAALELARADPPDLCVVDYAMPGLSGADLVRAIRSAPEERLRSVPALGLSGFDDGVRELVAAGAVDALRKPCSETTLVAGVLGALGPHARG